MYHHMVIITNESLKRGIIIGKKEFHYLTMIKNKTLTTYTFGRTKVLCRELESKTNLMFVMGPLPILGDTLLTAIVN